MRSAVGGDAILLMAAAAALLLLLPLTAAFTTVNNHHHHSPPNHPKLLTSSSSSSNNNSNMMIILHNSLRDLLGAPDDKNYDISSNNNNNNKNKSPPKEDSQDDDEEALLDTSNADNFNNMLHPQRRNFQGRPSQDSGRLLHVDDDELGLNMDRLRAFSFSGHVARENTRVRRQGGKGNSSGGGGGGSSSVVVDTEAADTVRANDFNNMVGIAYSKKSTSSLTANRNPMTQQISSRDVDRETGMHADKISTFSFSSQNTKSAFLDKAVSGSNGGSSLRGATWAAAATPPSNKSSSISGGAMASSVGDDYFGKEEEEGTIGGESKEERQKRMKEEVAASAMAVLAAAAAAEAEADDTELRKEDIGAAAATTTTPSTITTTNDAAMNVDNFHNMVNVDMSKNTGLKRLISPRTGDGQVNHADRMETFSLLSTEDSENDGSSNEAPETLQVNHGDRMGTFSFASSGTAKKAKLQQAASAAPVVKNESESKQPATTADNSTPLPSKEDNNNVDSLDSRSQVYSFAESQKGSLSSLASSLKTHSRADRIKEIKILTDPKLLHPDGMNIPRLNARGDVMSMSSTTGRMNVFERIEADLANKSQDDAGIGGDIVAEKKELEKEEESNHDENEKDGEEKKEDIVGEK